MSDRVTVPGLPSATQNAQAILAAMAALNGIPTDYNKGSIIRTIAESLGYVVEEQGAELNTLAFQTIVYGAYSAYGIYPISATSSQGTITFLTSNAVSPPAATQNIPIPSGTIVQTAGGTQFYTVQDLTLPSGQVSASVGIAATVPGSGSNVPASSIVQIAQGVAYPLYAINALATSGGADAEAPNQTAARFAAAVSKPGLASPQAVANSVIGVSYSGETVQFSTVYESGLASGIAGFVLYVDDGAGSASAGLLSAVTGYINSNPGYRPVGVPYLVSSVVPVTATVGVTGTLFPQFAGSQAQIQSAITNGVQGLFAALPFSTAIYQGNVAAEVGNSAPGVLSSIQVSLNGGAVNYVSAGPAGQRVILSSLSVSVS